MVLLIQKKEKRKEENTESKPSQDNVESGPPPIITIAYNRQNEIIVNIDSENFTFPKSYSEGECSIRRTIVKGIT